MYRYNRKGFLEDDDSSDDSIFIVDPGWDDYCLQELKLNRPALVDIKVDRALKDTMVISVPNPTNNGVMMHTIKVEYEWKPSRFGTCLVFSYDDMQCPKSVVTALRK
ncbi:hypothetical protein Tco_0970371 [Tanacetum coccineum]